MDCKNCIEYSPELEWCIFWDEAVPVGGFVGLKVCDGYESQSEQKDDISDEG